MLKIEGKYSTAICYAKVIEDEAVVSDGALGAHPKLMKIHTLYI